MVTLDFGTNVTNVFLRQTITSLHRTAITSSSSKKVVNSPDNLDKLQSQKYLKITKQTVLKDVKNCLMKLFPVSGISGFMLRQFFTLFLVAF